MRLPDLAHGFIPLDLPHWQCQRLRLEAEDEISVHFFATAHGDKARLHVLPAGRSERGTYPLRRCSVRYGFELGDPARRPEVARLLRLAAAAIDARLEGTPPGTTLAAAFGRKPGQLTFDAEGLLALCAPDILPAVPLAGGWTLQDVHPAWLAFGAGDATRVMSLDFAQPSGALLTLQILPRQDDQPAFLHTAHLSLRMKGADRGEDGASQTLRNVLGFILEVRDHAGLDVHVSEERVAVPQPATPVAAAPVDGIACVSLLADCGQACVFCSVRDALPPRDGGEAALRQACATLAECRRQGLSSARIAGFDPLAFSRILDLLRFARDAGYATASIESPGTLLADRAFCTAVWEAMPPTRRFNLALHGSTAADHDAVVGTLGAFARLMSGIRHIQELGDATTLSLSITAVAANLHDLSATVQLAGRLGIPCNVQLAYTNTESREDRFFGVSPTQTATVDALLAVYRAPRRQPLPLSGVAPCVLVRRLALAGLGIRGRLDLEKLIVVAGSEDGAAKYVHGARQDQALAVASLPCPAAPRCALHSVCGEVGKAYAAKFGLAEFEAVTPAELVAAV